MTNKRRYSLALAAIAFLITAPCICMSGQEVNTLRAPAYPLITIDPYISAWSAADHLYDKTITHWTGTKLPMDGIISVDGIEYRFMGSDSFYEPVSECILTGDWESTDMHIEREYYLEEIPEDQLFIRYSNRKATKIFINGNFAADTKFGCIINHMLPLDDNLKSMLRPGKNIISAISHNNRAERSLNVELVKWNNVPSNNAVQTSVNVQATRTLYSFDCGPVSLDLCFAAPLLPDDLDMISRPVNYISYDIRSKDGRKHDISIKIRARASGWTVNSNDQPVTTEVIEAKGMSIVKGGSREQKMLEKYGDNVRIDWGHLYLAGSRDCTATAENDSMELERHCHNAKKVSGHWMLAYDDIRSVQYFGENLRPYWNRDGSHDIIDILAKAELEYASLMKRCEKFDNELFTEAMEAGGRKYAELCALAYRQTIAAHKLVMLPNGELGLFSKENSSNGSIGTVDVTYPSAPLFLKYNPELCAALLNHIFDYTESGRWTKPFPAHDVGYYPLANGQTYSADMPVEESGNMLILTAVVCAASKDWSYAERHWETLTLWEEYLEKFGLDPEDQLCTDDFAGRMPHNANLSVKAILGIASYAQMAGKLGKSDISEGKTGIARNLALQWIEKADAGDHFALTFGNKESWSQKYNLVWNELLSLNVFPDSVKEKELSFYSLKFNNFGLPLDNRESYTKSDWTIWTASLSRDKKEFESYVEPVWDFYNTTDERIPMSDWFYSDKPYSCNFIARSVVGGYFIKMLQPML